MLIEIVPYEGKYKEAFKSLNLEWLDKYNLTEEPDLLVLNDPEGTILQQGGYIWLAIDDGLPVGSVALINEGDSKYEVAKMSVAPSHQGRGISKILMEICISKAKEIGANKLLLFSNHQLAPALKLYEGYGFQYVDVEDSPFQTADVKMELYL